MSALDLDALRNTPVSTNPFDHLIVPGFIRAESIATIGEDFPKIDMPGSFPCETLEFGPAFHAMIGALKGEEMTALMAEKFDVDLSDKPTMMTIRGRCRSTDGKIHTDSAGKLITVLIYMNDEWDASGGRLRLLRSADSLEDFAAEVPPDAGTLLAFRCTPTAWHGHRPFEGRRRAIQLNWVTGDVYLSRERRRHKVSAFFKKFHFAS